MYTIWSKVSIKTVIHFSVRKSLIFGNHTDNIHSEAIDSFFTPEFHHVINFLAYFFIFPIEIRLFFWKQMQIIHLSLRIIFPCRTAKCSAPVIRFFSVYRIFPDIIITIWIIFWFTAFNKPVMFIWSMVDYEIHQNPDGSFVCFTQQFLVILHRSIFFINSAVIRNIVTIIVLRWFQHRRNPQYIYPKFFKVIQFLYDSSDISHTITVTVFKTLWIYLIYYTFFPPFFLHAKPPRL